MTSTPLTSALLRAKRGFRSDVAALWDALGDCELLLPLAQPIAGAGYGERLELSDTTEIRSHLLVSPDGKLFAALFSEPELLDPVERTLGWKTAGETLEFCSMPARAALELALDAIDDREVLGLVFNPMHESELLLLRHELSSLLGGKPIPLVGYVRDIPLAGDEHTLVADGEPPPPELSREVERCVALLPGLLGFELSRTFNAERDIEPHLTLHLLLAASADRDAVVSEVMQRLEGKLPAPGYIDVLIREQ